MSVRNMHRRPSAPSIRHRRLTRWQAHRAHYWLMVVGKAIVYLWPKTASALVVASEAVHQLSVLVLRTSCRRQTTLWSRIIDGIQLFMLTTTRQRWFNNILYRITSHHPCSLGTIWDKLIISYDNSKDFPKILALYAVRFLVF